MGDDERDTIPCSLEGGGENRLASLSAGLPPATGALTNRGPVRERRDVQPEVVPQRGADSRADPRVDEIGDTAVGQDAGRANPANRDRADLGAQDQPVLGLATLACRDRDLAGIARGPAGGGDRTDCQQTRAVERLIGNDEGPPPSGPLGLAGIGTRLNASTAARAAAQGRAGELEPEQYRS